MPHAAVLPFLLLHLLQDLLLVHGFTTKSEERRWHDACTREVGAAKLRFCMKKARREGRGGGTQPGGAQTEDVEATQSSQLALVVAKSVQSSEI